MTTGRVRRVALAAAALLAGVAAPDAVGASPGQASAPARITVTRIPVPEGYRAAGDSTGSRTFIEAGWVVFEVYSEDADAQVQRLVVRDPDGTTDLVPEPVRAAEDVSRRGHVVGVTDGTSTCEGGSQCPQPYLWSRGRFTVLPTAGRPGAAAGVNDRGQVAGWTTRATSPSPERSAAVVWDGSRTSVLDDARASSAADINNRGQVAVNFGTYPDFRAAVWHPGRGVTELGTLGGDWSWAGGINERGEVYGTSATADGATHSFLWRDGEMIDLGTLGGERTQALALNDRGHVAGRSHTADGVWHAFLWRDGEMTNLVPGSLSGRAEALNNRGDVVGITATSDFLWRDGEVIDVGSLVSGLGYNRVAIADIDDQGRMVGTPSRRVGDAEAPAYDVLVWRIR